MTLNKLITSFSIYSALVPLLIGVLHYKKLNRAQWLVLVLVTVSFTCDKTSTLVWRMFGNNYMIIHSYIVIEALILGFYFKHILKAKWVFVPVTLFLIVYLINVVSVGPAAGLLPMLNGFRCLLFLLLCIYSFYYQFTNSEEIFIEKTSNFWFNVGFLTYFSGALFSWLLANYINAEDTSSTWIFHNLANGLKNFLLAIGLWKARSN